LGVDGRGNWFPVYVQYEGDEAVEQYVRLKPGKMAQVKGPIVVKARTLDDEAVVTARVFPTSLEIKENSADDNL